MNDARTHGATRTADSAAGLEESVIALCRGARAASAALALASTDAKNTALRAGAAALRVRAKDLLAANATDVGAAAGATSAFIDRLTLTPARIEAMAVGVEQVADLPDPVGEIVTSWTRPNGLAIAQVR